mmetsp:Transcript_27222/g.45334  ORF Transcript_27222/g.45334 Transcript_27222/m.45334 type:complete len:90 (-) Transcript_27222:122-391(-)
MGCSALLCNLPTVPTLAGHFMQLFFIHMLLRVIIHEQVVSANKILCFIHGPAVSADIMQNIELTDAVTSSFKDCGKDVNFVKGNWNIDA